MNAFEWIAEQRIEEAIARGELSDLPGAGRPLRLDDDALVPPEVRMAYRILRNAGFVPPELADRRQAASLRALMAVATDEEEQRRAAGADRLLRGGGRALARLLTRATRGPPDQPAATGRAPAGCPGTAGSP